jgi:UDP-GlcNAc:undecaprenyl-phosphate GlcNAc-1-phosphate transferase
MAAVVAAGGATLLTPLAQRLAQRFGALREPRTRDVHVEPIPRWGGLAIYGAWVVALAAAVLLWELGGRPVKPETVMKGGGIVLGATLLTVIGAIDDRVDLSPGAQMAGQIICAALVMAFGVRIDVLTNPATGQMIHLGYWQWPVTLVWLVGVANAVNWIDGIDGLAAGVCAIAAGTLALLAAAASQPALAVLAAALCGSLLGFLRHNFNPAKIFMGGGAPVVGLVLASVSGVGAFKMATTVAMAVPVLVLGLPIFDTALVILRRWRAGKPIYVADKSHLHHTLLARGLTQRQTVLCLYAVSLVTCVTAVAMALGFRR